MIKIAAIFTMMMLTVPAKADELQDLKKLIAMQQAGMNALVPAGTIVAFGGSTPPAGWKICNGATVLRVDYPALFQAIGTAWGKRNEVEFNLPDLRGRFLRGVDAGADRDADRAKRLASSPGGNEGDRVGSTQDDETAKNSLLNAESSVKGRIYGGAHTHSYNGVGAHPWNGAGPGGTGVVQITNFNGSQDASVSSGGSEHTHDFTLAAGAQEIKGGNETRPTNANVQYIIKY